MPSHCFIQTEAPLDPIQLERDIKDIIHNKFNDLFKIESHTLKNEICDWLIIFDNIYNFPICLKARNKIEFTHPDNYFSLWAQLVIEDELASKYNAKMFDEEYPHTDVKPDKIHHATFKTFLEYVMSRHSSAWKKAIITIELDYLPEVLRNL